VSILEFVDDIGDEWKWVLTFHCDTVELPVVLDQPEFTILFLYKEGRSKWGLQFSDISLVKHVLEECIQGLLLLNIKWIYFAVVGRDHIQFKLNAMIPLPEWWKGSRGFFFKNMAIFQILFQYQLCQGFGFLLQVFLHCKFCELGGMMQGFFRTWDHHKDFISYFKTGFFSQKVSYPMARVIMLSLFLCG